MEKSLGSEAWAQLWTLRITVSVRTGVRGARLAKASLTRPTQFLQAGPRKGLVGFLQLRLAQKLPGRQRSLDMESRHCWLHTLSS